MDWQQRRLIHLRIKIKSLAEEAKIIRQEARRVKGLDRQELNEHKVEVVRKYARSNLLAYGLLRGVPYIEMEKKCNETPEFSEVIKIAKKFGGSQETIDAWMEEMRSNK